MKEEETKTDGLEALNTAINDVVASRLTDEEKDDIINSAVKHILGKKGQKSYGTMLESKVKNAALEIADGVIKEMLDNDPDFKSSIREAAQAILTSAVERNLEGVLRRLPGSLFHGWHP